MKNIIVIPKVTPEIHHRAWGPNGSERGGKEEVQDGLWGSDLGNMEEGSPH